MSDEFGNVPPQPEEPVVEKSWGTPVETGYQQVPPPPGYMPPAGYPPQASSGLSDSAAGAIAYLTFIPAVVFLLLEPYKNKAFVRFHCIQELCLTVCMFILHFFWMIPFLGWAIAIVGYIVLFIVWCLSILKASQGGSFKIPVIGKFAAEQSGYRV